MRFVVTVNMDNAAFGENEQERRRELARILAKLSKTVGAEDVLGLLRHRLRLLDINGNVVGEAGVIP